MPYHHLALASRDTRATDLFYREVMGFRLVKVEPGATPTGGWAKHFFYDTGDGSMIAFWELHDETIPESNPTAISGGLGYPDWVNHIAFRADDREGLDSRRAHINAQGYDVLEIDHGWCISIYTTDPNGILVEFCVSVREFTADDIEEASVLLHAETPPMKAHEPAITGWEGEGAPLHERVAAAS